MRCLDLFCGGFGAGHGYQRAGFDVTGVDMVRRANHPPGVTFVKAKVESVLTDVDWLRTFDLIHASPPCKENTRLTGLRDAQGGKAIHQDMLAEVRDALDAAGVPYVLENVEGASMRPDILLCGSMFGLWVTDSQGDKRWLRRHRLFELGHWGAQGVMMQPEDHHPDERPMGIYGSMGDVIPNGGQTCETLDQARDLMGTPWMSWAAITQAIPPVYTEYLGTLARGWLS